MRRSLQHRRQPPLQLLNAGSDRDVRRNQRPKINLELRGSESHRRSHLVDQRPAEVPTTLSTLEISLRIARDSPGNLRCGEALTDLTLHRFNDQYCSP